MNAEERLRIQRHVYGRATARIRTILNGATAP
jgi:hypothetical protein